MRKLFLLAFLMLTVTPSWGQPASTDSSADDQAQLELLKKGRQLLDAGKPEEAMTGYMDLVISNFQTRYGASREKIYCARTSPESLAYLGQAALDNKGDAVVLPAVWAEAYFMKGYALIDLGRIAEAKPFLEQAIAFSPHNSQFLSELGNVYQAEKNWPRALELYQSAEVAALSFSPDEEKAFELGRARRGVGFVLVELGQLDEAEAKYRQCLKENPQDRTAAAELEYVLNLKIKNNSAEK